MKIALIGGGEVGRCYAKALHKLGYQVYLIIDNHPSTALTELAVQIQATVETSASKSLKEADLVLSAVFGSVAFLVAKEVAPFLSEGCLYADLSTGTPADMLEAFQVFEARHLKFIDVALASTVNLYQEKTPLLLAGPYAAELLPLADQLQAKATVVGNEAGAAVSLKLLRSIFTKGCEALAVECFTAAEKKGLLPAFYEVLSDLDEQPITVFLESCVNSHVTHAPRRLIEVREAIAQLQALGIDPVVSQGVEALFERTSKQLIAQPYSAGNLQKNIAWLQKIASNSDCF